MVQFVFKIPKEKDWLWLKNWMIDNVFNIGIGITIIYVGWILSKWIGKVAQKVFIRGGMDQGLVTFLGNLITILLKVVTFVTAINQLGIATTSIFALLASAGLAIGLAFSGTLANFVGGMVILLFKPFRVNDFITAQNQSGKVTEIQIFYTYLLTSENKVAVIPNGILANGSMVNSTREGNRRVEWSLHLTNGSDFKRLKPLLFEWLKNDARVLDNDKMLVEINEITMDSVHVIVRAWAQTDEVQQLQYDFNASILEILEKETIPLVRK
jgi:small conductance mechanosensitive channel